MTKYVQMSSLHISVELIRCLEVAEKMASGSGQILTNKFCISPDRLMHKPTAFSSLKMAKVSFPDGPTAVFEVTHRKLESNCIRYRCDTKTLKSFKTVFSTYFHLGRTRERRDFHCTFEPISDDRRQKWTNTYLAYQLLQS